MMLYPILVLLLHAVSPGLSFNNLCPPIEDLLPCHCVTDGQNIRVDCIQVTSVEDVRRALQSVKGIQRVFIDFLKARLEKVPSDLFQGLHVTKLSFTNCDLKQIGDEGRSALEGLEDVIEEFSVHFSFNGDNELKFMNLSRLRAIEDIEIEGNEMTELSNDWFREGPTNVQSLYIQTNLFEKLGDAAFAPLKNLKTLWLNGNRFKTFKRSMLPSPALHLADLDLSNNQISSLPADMFSGMPSLKKVDLVENAIQFVAEDTWSSVWSQLTRVDLGNNPLECGDSNIKWMFQLPRPYVLKGYCAAPSDRKKVALRAIIDQEKRERDYNDY